MSLKPGFDIAQAAQSDPMFRDMPLHLQRYLADIAKDPTDTRGGQIVVKPGDEIVTKYADSDRVFLHTKGHIRGPRIPRAPYVFGAMGLFAGDLRGTRSLTLIADTACTLLWWADEVFEQNEELRGFLLSRIYNVAVGYSEEWEVDDVPVRIQLQDGEQGDKEIDITVAVESLYLYPERMEFTHICSVLHSSPLLRFVSNQLTRDLARVAKVTPVKEGQHLFEKGDNSFFLVFLIEGGIEIGENGFTVRAPGTSIGERGLCSSHRGPRLASAKAIEDTRVLVLKDEDLQQLPSRALILALYLLLMEYRQRAIIKPAA